MTGADIRSYSPTVAEIAEAIGLPAALALIEAFRGMEIIHGPKRMPVDHPILSAIGPEAAEALRVIWGGGEIRVASSRMVKSRKPAIIAALLAGRPDRDIAMEFDVTRAYIRQIRIACKIQRSPAKPHGMVNEQNAQNGREHPL